MKAKLVCVIFCLLFFKIKAQILIDYNNTPQFLVQNVLLKPNSGIKVKSVKYYGHNKSIAKFTTNSKIMPVKNGIVLSNGFAENLNGPNQFNGKGDFLGVNSTQSNIFTPYSTGKTWDEAVLEINFYASTSEISFNYVFGSEEYPEFVNKGVNDIFIFLVGKKNKNAFKNIAAIPNSHLPVSVDNINKYTNEKFFIENGSWTNYKNGTFKGTDEQLELAYNCEYDGLTKQLTAKANVEPYTLYTLKIGIADVGDGMYDSGILIKSNSFKSSGNSLPFAQLIQRNLKIINKDSTIFEFNKTNNSLSLVINFDFDSYLIKEKYTSSLTKLAELINIYFDKKVKIIGHTDKVGSNDYNMRLSEKRAEAVCNLLVKLGVNEKRLSFEGKGETELISSDNRKLNNRRVEFVFY